MLYTDNIIPFRIDSALIGYIFFWIGFHCKHLILKISILSIRWLFLGLSLGILFVWLEVIISDDIHSGQVLSINAISFGKYPIMYVPCALGGCYAVLCLSQIFARFKLNVVNNLSNGMIITLGFQCIIFQYIKELYTPDNSILMCTFVSCLVYVISYMLIFLTGRYTPVLLGNRKIK